MKIKVGSVRMVNHENKPIQNKCLVLLGWFIMK